jgi:putative DNA primase/helicase
MGNNTMEKIKDIETIDISPFEVLGKEKNNKQKRFMKNHISHKTIKNIPYQLKESKSWLYSNEFGAPCNTDKYNVNGIDHKNFNSFDNITSNNINNLYYTLSLHNNFFVIDLDDCIDNNNNLYDFAQDIVDQVSNMNPYIEYSKSFKGLHIIFENSIKWNNLKILSIKMKKIHIKYKELSNKSGIEFFNNNHCIILTGNVYKNFNPKKIGKLNNNVIKIYKRFEEYRHFDISKIFQNVDKKKRNKSLDENDIFDYIKSKVSIEEILRLYEIELNDNENMNCPLPDHEDNTPSFRFYLSDNSFYCFGCKKGGSIIDFVMHMDKCTMLQSCKKINEAFDLNVDFSFENDLNYDWVIFNNGKYEIDLTILRNHLIYEHYVYNTEHELLIYDDFGYFKNIKPYELKKIIENHLPSIYNNKYKKDNYVTEVYNQLLRNFMSSKHFNTCNNIINLKNVILQTSLGYNNLKVIDKSPEFKNTYIINYDYDKTINCNVWLKFLNETLSQEQQKIVQEIFGYCLINNNRAKKFFCLYGPGDCGKSVILEVLKRLIGENQTSAMSLQDLTNKNSKFNTAPLRNTLVNICGDIPALPIEDSSIVNLLTGDDYMRFEKKGKDPIFQRNTSRLLFSMNRFPPSRDKSKEFFNRMLIIPFYNVCPKNLQDKNLIDKFNIQGVLTWAVEGLKRLMKNNLNFSEVEENNLLKDHYSIIDSPVIDFITSCCTITTFDNDMILQKDMMKYYKYFCIELLNNKYSAKMKTNNFIEEMHSKFPSVIFSKNLEIFDKKHQRGFKRIKINDEFIKDYESSNEFNLKI